MAVRMKNVIRTLQHCADEYGKNLANRSLLFVCRNKNGAVFCLEVAFAEADLLRLTGIRPDPALPGREFYRALLAKRLPRAACALAPDGTTEVKLRALPLLVQKDLSARWVGGPDTARPRLFTDRMAGGGRGVLRIVRDARGGRFVPCTVLKEERPKEPGSVARILATYRKGIRDAAYSEIVYAAKGVNWRHVALPGPYAGLPLPSGEDETEHP